MQLGRVELEMFFTDATDHKLPSMELSQALEGSVETGSLSCSPSSGHVAAQRDASFGFELVQL